MPSLNEHSPDATNPLLAAALSYARRGWPVFPLRSSEKIPDGRLVRHGLRGASTDERQLRAWWAASPAANVGLRTGLGLDVVDLDSAAARARLEALSPGQGDLGSLGASVVVRTGRGWHLWFAAGGLTTRAGVLEGIDLRGRGGYVVAPPSLHPSGGQYLFVDPETGELGSRLPEVALNSVPSWLATLLSPEGSCARTARESPPVLLDASAYVRVAVESECAAVARTPEGARNDRLNRAAFSIGTLVGAGLLEHGEAEHALLEAAQRAGLAEREARRTIASGLAAGALRPRTVASDRSPQRPRRDPNEARKRPAAPGQRADLATAAVRGRARRSQAMRARANRVAVRPAPFPRARRGLER